MSHILSPQNRTRVLIGSAFAIGLATIGTIAGFSLARATAQLPAPLTLHLNNEQPGFAPLVATVRPAVVNISTTEAIKPSTQPFSDPEFENFLRQFFGPTTDQMLRQAQRPTTALGSGFIVDPAGYIVTNNHVIDGASDIQVTLSNGNIYKARVIGRDTKTDLALLKIDAGTLPYVAFGNSDTAQVGDWVVAVGNPYGLGGSVSAGIISGEKRNINEGPYDSFLQVDAPINPGNSGGPLFNLSGHVIGIDTAIYTPSGGSVGIGFAIPSNVASRVVAQLREHGKVERGWLGVQMQEMTPALAKAIGLRNTNGVLIDMVTPDSPASHAGFRQGDVITAFGDKPIHSTRDLAFAVADTPAGKSVPAMVWRDGRALDLTVRIGSQTPAPLAKVAARDNSSALGLELTPLTGDEQASNGSQSGALVDGVVPGSLADQSGIQSGDVILGAGTNVVRSPPDVEMSVRLAEERHRPALPLLIQRDGVKQYLALSLNRRAG